MSISPADLAPHSMKVALLQPQIAPNTGNIARLCVASGTELHLVRPLGFVLSDRNLKRSGMDYWSRLRLTVHDDTELFFRAIGDARFWLYTTKASAAHWDAPIADGDWLIFGSETNGIADTIREKYPDRQLRIPQTAGERCLNLSTAVGIGLYDAIRRLRKPATG